MCLNFMVSSNLDTNSAIQSLDALIIGGGPAGSTAGAWLGNKKVRALICEKEQFPRFHIGESLLPNGNHILQEIGVWEKVRNAGYIEKWGAEFTLPDRSSVVRNIFSEGMVKKMDMTYQVERSHFDKLLLDHAAESGCEVRQRTRVSKATYNNHSWAVVIENLDTGQEQTIYARWIIDASGRNCVMGRTLNFNKEVIPYPGRFAVFNHFKDFKRATGKEGGDTLILRLENAWFWAIPISETITSVGVVAQTGDRTGGKESREDFFWKKVHESPFLTEALSEATAQQDYLIESDYCFSYETFGQDQVLLAGDAASFIDPVFSSGVYLALESGLLAAKTVHHATSNKSVTGKPKTYKNYTKIMKRRIRTIRRLIETFYDNSSFEVFMVPRPKHKIPNAINSIVAGCTLPPFRVRWRYWLFEKLCALHKKIRIAEAIDWKSMSDASKKKDSLNQESASSSEKI